MNYRTKIPWLVLLIIVLGGWQDASTLTNSTDVGGFNIITVVVGALIAMLGGMWLVFARSKDSPQPFGDSQLKALGLVLFLPTLLIIAVVHDEFGASSLSALLGTVAGYVLSKGSGSGSD